MRVLSMLSLLCLSALGVSSQYVMDATSTASNWVITGNATPNPPLSFNASSTYTFDVSLTTNHPFNFTTVATNTAVTSLDSTLYTISGSAGCTANTLNGYAAAVSSPAGTCIVTLKIAANAPAATIYYQCTKHPLMSGQITVSAAAAAGTTAAPTTASPTTAAPTATPGGTLTGNAFHITGAVFPTAYIFTANDKTYLNPTLQITGGSTFTISIDFINTNHPFGFSPKSNTDTVQINPTYFPNDLNSGTGYSLNTFCDTTAGNSNGVKNLLVANTTNSCVVTIQTQTSSGTAYYRCAYHRQMVGTINIIGNTATTIAGAGLAIIVAIIATIMM